jgi:hypothetical protein
LTARQSFAFVKTTRANPGELNRTHGSRQTPRPLILHDAWDRRVGTALTCAAPRTATGSDGRRTRFEFDIEITSS